MDIDKFRPMLACPAPSVLQFPLLASPKLDGIRCVKIGGRALTRKLKPVPNRFIRGWIESNLPDGVDGELMLEDMTAPFAEVSSAVMSEDGVPMFLFAAFDFFGAGLHVPFHERHAALHGIEAKDRRFVVVPHESVASSLEVEHLTETCIANGFEGVMLRHPNGPYKTGRSTAREGYLMKVKQFEDEEAVVLFAIEEMENTNEAVTNELGLTKRSSAKAGKVAKGVLGALRCRFDDGVEFEVGSGFTDQQKADLWKVQTELVGAKVTVKHQPPPGGRSPGESPRFPVFKGFRHD